jgi:hypothetical protein
MVLSVEETLMNFGYTYAPNLIHQGASVITEISSANGYRNPASSNSYEFTHGPKIYLSLTKIRWRTIEPQFLSRKTSLWYLHKNLWILFLFQPQTYKLLPTTLPDRLRTSSPLQLWRISQLRKRFLPLFIMIVFKNKLNQTLSLNLL